MVRKAIAVWAPLCVALSVGGIVGLGAIAACGRLGLELPAREQAFPVVALVVLFGARGAMASAHRLALLLRRRDPYHPGVRR